MKYAVVLALGLGLSGGANAEGVTDESGQCYLKVGEIDYIVGKCTIVTDQEGFSISEGGWQARVDYDKDPKKATLTVGEEPKVQVEKEEAEDSLGCFANEKYNVKVCASPSTAPQGFVRKGTCTFNASSLPFSQTTESTIAKSDDCMFYRFEKRDDDDFNKVTLIVMGPEQKVTVMVGSYISREFPEGDQLGLLYQFRRGGEQSPKFNWGLVGIVKLNKETTCWASDDGGTNLCVEEGTN
jgi:hypothetical protein